MLIRMGMGTQLSGSVGGVVASHNKGGAYLRGRSVPTNPNSSRQQSTRAAFAAAAIGWSSLTLAQREAWEGYAVGTPITNRLGDSITTSGFNMYVRSAAFFGGAGQAAVSDAPTVPGVVSLGATVELQLSEASGFFVVNVGSDAEGAFVLSMGPAVSPGVLSFKGPYSAFHVGLDVVALSVNAIAANVSPLRYGAPIQGEFRPVRLAASNTDGRLSNTFEAIVAVSA